MLLPIKTVVTINQPGNYFHNRAGVVIKHVPSEEYAHIKTNLVKMQKGDISIDGKYLVPQVLPKCQVCKQTDDVGRSKYSGMKLCKVCRRIEERGNLRRQVAVTAKVASKQDWYCIIIAQIVRGKSKGPSGFTRYKPFAYSNSLNAHPIVYAKWVHTSDEKKAISEAQKTYAAMKRIFDEADTEGSYGYTKSFGVVLHSWNKNKAIKFRNDSLSNKGYLYDNTTCSNSLLKQWGIAI